MNTQSANQNQRLSCYIIFEIDQSGIREYRTTLARNAKIALIESGLSESLFIDATESESLAYAIAESAQKIIVSQKA
jgi:hypothetical protein